MTDVLKVADGAEMIVNGYAFTKCEEDQHEHAYIQLHRTK